MAAVLGGKSDSVRLLLRSGADPELPNREGMTPLQAAAFQNQRDVIEALIEGGAVVEVRCDGSEGSHDKYMDRSIMQKNKAPRWCWQKFGPDGYSLLHRATWRPGEAAVDALVYLLDFLDVDTRAVRTLFVEGCSGSRPNRSVVVSLQTEDAEHSTGQALESTTAMLPDSVCSQVRSIPEKKKKKKAAGIRQTAAPGATPLMEAAARGQVRACSVESLDMPRLAMHNRPEVPADTRS